MLAPMEDITDPSFRTICHKYGADLTFTEMVRIDPLSRNNAATWSRLDVKDSTPVIIQLLGTNEPRLKKFLKMFKPHEGFEGFNFNLGCPSPQVIKLGQGCAMIKRISKTKKLVNIIHDYGYNCSIKMRLGMNKFEKEKKIYLNLIDAVPAKFFIVHARYGAQTYKEEPDYSVYEECVKTGKNIIANGNITTKEQVEYFKKINVKGIMIGRKAVNNPSIFNELKGLKSPNLETVKKEYLELSKKYNAPFKYQKNVLKHLGEKNEEYKEE